MDKLVLYWPVYCASGLCLNYKKECRVSQVEIIGDEQSIRNKSIPCLSTCINLTDIQCESTNHLEILNN